MARKYRPAAPKIETRAAATLERRLACRPLPVPAPSPSGDSALTPPVVGQLPVDAGAALGRGGFERSSGRRHGGRSTRRLASGPADNFGLCRGAVHAGPQRLLTPPP